MAFQPIVDAATLRAYAYEALVRGPEDHAALVGDPRPSLSYRLLGALGRVGGRLVLKLGVELRAKQDATPVSAASTRATSSRCR